MTSLVCLQQDCIKYENGRDVCGSSIIVEWAKGNPRRPLVGSVFNHSLLISVTGMSALCDLVIVLSCS